ncbi:hypothetical protein ASG37_12765 [Sphingomonas sp. Leaf407]|uniref:hypothetical protein n=1 Tax=unclassified Sphingomonas TaxID=196159 RepID=UPI0006F269B2|nr:MULTISPECIES: hypothetical protein [unclassified Sphingomonas]KQN36474.1 hypothetical protein ASE97_12020 [Sphingomonas sp. Leaf42]KQT27094.1 hypothetical protein ASG37_12765 [Sphingomonas sp. Leaf407]
MPVVEFENRKQRPLVLSIEPTGDRIEVPPLGRAAIRYSLPEHAEDRYHAAIGEHRIDVWCDAGDYEVDIVPPSPSDRLLWAICVELGYCGGVVDGEPVTVTDLIPAAGVMTAGEFAELAIRADGWPASSPLPDNALRRLQTKFVECFGRTSVEADVFHRVTRRPFDRDPA